MNKQWQHFFCRVVAISALWSLAGCTLRLDVLLYNNTQESITLRSSSTGKTIVVVPHASANVTEFFSMSPEVVQGRRTYRYLLPMLSIPAGYEEADTLGRRERFEFASDHRLYILPNGDLPGRKRSSQPDGFPLAPL